MAGYKRYDGWSMGAQIRESVCALCGLSGSHTHKMTAGRDRVFQDGVEVFPLSMVAGPRCEACATEMLYLRRGTAWACQNKNCDQYDLPVETGVGGITS